MKNIGLRIKKEMLESLDEEAKNKNISRSEYIRQILDNRHNPEKIKEEYEKEIEKLENRIKNLEEKLEDIKKERDNLENKLKATNTRIDDVQEVVEFAKKQKSVLQKKEKMKYKPVWIRLKYWLFGRNREN